MAIFDYLKETLDGGLLTTKGGRVGFDLGALGTVVVSGTGTIWDNSADGILIVGLDGIGSMSALDGGSVLSNSATIGSAGSGSGSVVVDDATWDITFTLGVGAFGDGDLTIRNTGTVTSNFPSTIASQSNSTGNVTVTGTGSSWANDGRISVGGFGDGTLSILNGASVTGTDAEVGVLSGGSGGVLVSGTNSLWNNTGNLTVGGDGSGSVSIQNNAQVTVAGTADVNAGASISLAGGATLDVTGATTTDARLS